MDLNRMLKERGCKSSHSAWQAFTKGADYFQDHVPELIEAAQGVVDKCAGRNKKRPSLADDGQKNNLGGNLKTNEMISQHINQVNPFSDKLHYGRNDTGGLIVAEQGKQLAYYLFTLTWDMPPNDQEDWIKFVTKMFSNKYRDAMLISARSIESLSILEFDKNPYLFNCQNGTINLKTFEFWEHRPEDFLSKISNVVFDPAARCERWETFISEIMNGNIETAKFLQKALGYALSGDTSEECFFILYGSTTRNGKGTSMETTLHLMGDYGRTAQPETIAQKNNTHSSGPTEDVARLKGARFVNMSEPDKGLHLNSALVKQLTGGDTVTARYLHQNSFEYRPEYKLFINTNHRLRITDDSIFSSGRVHEIPFERHFNPDERDKGLKSFFKQPENISGIFNWFVEGLRLMQTEGMEEPPAVKRATAQYREESDTVGLFVRDCLEPCTNYKTKTKEIYVEYEKWCAESGYRPHNLSGLIEELRKKGMVKRDKKLGNIIYNYMIATELPFSV